MTDKNEWFDPDDLCGKAYRATHKGKNAIDLHTHTMYSDGSLTPTKLIDYAIYKGLKAIAITDHDTVAGLDEAINYAADKDIELIPGVELSTEWRDKDIHIVGLNIDYKQNDFVAFLKDFVDSRDVRNRKMCRLLTDAGMPVKYEELKRTYPDSVITRGHYARYMLDKGYTTYLREAFERYIGDNGPYYVPREKTTAADGVRLIMQAGGIPILAHPMLYHMNDDRLKELTDELKPLGLMGMETVYTTNSSAEERDSRVFAKENGLLISGGSDYHGEAKPRTDLGMGFGDLYVDASIWTDLKNAQAARDAKL